MVWSLNCLDYKTYHLLFIFVFMFPALSRIISKCHGWILEVAMELVNLKTSAGL